MKKREGGITYKIRGYDGGEQKKGQRSKMAKKRSHSGCTQTHSSKAFSAGVVIECQGNVYNTADKGAGR